MKIFKVMLHYFRQILWMVLGVPWSTMNWMARRKYLSTADWVNRGSQTYDNGALVWRWSPNEKVEIGKYCSIAFGVQFLAGNGHHHAESVTTFPLVRSLFSVNDQVELRGEKLSRKDWDNKMAISNGPIVIGSDVWIGQNSIILSGVTVGDGAIINAGSVVASDIPAYGIVGGVPARLIKYRFTPEITQSLQQIRWWDWPETLIKERIADFYDIDTFVIKYAPNNNKSR